MLANIAMMAITTNNSISVKARWFFFSDRPCIGPGNGDVIHAIPGYFNIPLTTKFVIVTLLAHLIFGVVMGLTALRLWKFLTPPVPR